MGDKMEARADLAADKLTTSTGYNRKVEFSTSFLGLPLHDLPQRAIRTWRLLEATGGRPVYSSTRCKLR